MPLKANKIEPDVLKPRYELTREQLNQLVEEVTGQKPKPGAHSISIMQSLDRKKGVITWVDVASDPVEHRMPESAPQGLKKIDMSKSKGGDGKNNSDS